MLARAAVPLAQPRNKKMLIVKVTYLLILDKSVTLTKNNVQGGAAQNKACSCWFLSNG